MRALLLSGPFGLGHEMPVRGFGGLLRQSNWETRSLDSMELLGTGAGQRVFDQLLALPGVYDGLHFAQLRAGGRVARMMERAAARRVVPALRADLAREPADLVLSVFATGALAAARLKAEAPERRTVVYCPDVAAHKLWVHEGTDLFLVSSRAAAASVRRFRPRAPVEIVPPPVRSPFYAAPSRTAARAGLGVPDGAPCVLLIDSGWGFAPLVDAAVALAGRGVRVLAVAGRNAAVEGRLRAAAAARRGITAFGFTDRVPELMAAADLVIALPGAATCAEARVVGRRLLLLDVMPGHGRDNLLHELEQGNAGVCGLDASDIVASALALLSADLPGDTLGGLPRAPRWEPLFIAALRTIGLEISPVREAAPCVPSS